MDYKDLLAYKKSFALAMLVFDVSKAFPKEEKYSLTDQIRRSSRSVTVTITESYRKRVYPKIWRWINSTSFIIISIWKFFKRGDKKVFFINLSGY